jgi:peptidoglycan/LPS O-acetylase OafA/YrhL
MNQSSLQKSTYRSEIDGLRAFAVLSVVAFHAFPTWLKGGFIGVDIFFVISGFLITRHIFENLDKGQFSFTDFFGRRIRRIFPSLIFVLACSLGIGWFVLVADEYALLGKHIASSVAFVINFILADEKSSYFDVAAETKPMLHLWSLAVEEQFYLILPLVLWVAWNSKLHLLKVTLTVAAVSFFLNLLLVESHPSKNFFWPVGRFWEFLCGSILAWLILYKSEWVSFSKSVSNLFVFIGLLFLFASVFLINNDLKFLSYWVFFPIIGSLLVIIGGSKSYLSQLLLQNPFAKWFGLISYPLYLWHWPLLSYLGIVNGYKPSWESRLGFVFLSIFLASFTYLFVEKHIRSKKVSTNLSSSLLITLSVIGMFGYSIYSMNGVESRHVAVNSSIIPRNINVEPIASIINECGLEVEIKQLNPFCYSDSRSTIKYAMLGDSKATSLFPGVVRASSDGGGRWLMIGADISESKRFKNSPHKPHLLPHALNAVKNNTYIEVVALVVAMRVFADFKQDMRMPTLLEIPQSNYEDGRYAIRSTIIQLLEKNKKVVIVLDNPPLGNHANCGEREIKLPIFGVVSKNLSNSDVCKLGFDEFLRLRTPYLEALQSIVNEFRSEVFIFDTAEIFCDKFAGVCLRYKNGINSFHYSDHISNYMADLIGEELNRFISGLQTQQN